MSYYLLIMFNYIKFITLTGNYKINLKLNDLKMCQFIINLLIVHISSLNE